MPRISRRKKPKKRNNCVRKKINHHCISHNSCLELRNAHFANSERISFLKPKRKRSPARKNYALGVSGLKKINSLAVGGFIP